VFGCSQVRLAKESGVSRTVINAIAHLLIFVSVVSRWLADQQTKIAPCSRFRVGVGAGGLVVRGGRAGRAREAGEDLGEDAVSGGGPAG